MTALLEQGWARGVSLVAAIALMLLVTLFPRALTTAEGRPIGHGVLMLIMWGLSAGLRARHRFRASQSTVARAARSPDRLAVDGVGLVFYIRYFF